MKDILLDFKKYIVGSKESTKIESASNIDFKKEVAKFAYFDTESFDIYQETLYNNVEDNLFYIGVANSSDLLGAERFHIAHTPTDIFKVLEKNAGGDMKVGITRQGRDFVEYFVAAKNHKYDAILIAGINDPGMFDRLTESLTEDHIKRTLAESEEELDMSYLYRPVGVDRDAKRLIVPLNLYDLVISELVEADIEIEDFGHDYFFSTLADLRSTLTALGLDYERRMKPAGGFVVPFNDHKKFRNVADKIINTYIQDYNLKSSTVSESIRLRIGE